MKHYRKDGRVRAVMIEINRKLYMDETTGKRLATFESARDRVSRLLTAAAQCVD